MIEYSWSDKKTTHEDTEECWWCGAPHGEYVQRKRDNPKDWKLSTRRTSARANLLYPSKVKIEQTWGKPNTGVCGQCWTDHLLINERKAALEIRNKLESAGV